MRDGKNSDRGSADSDFVGTVPKRKTGIPDLSDAGRDLSDPVFVDGQTGRSRGWDSADGRLSGAGAGISADFAKGAGHHLSGGICSGHLSGCGMSDIGTADTNLRKTEYSGSVTAGAAGIIVDAAGAAAHCVRRMRHVWNRGNIRL